MTAVSNFDPELLVNLPPIETHHCLIPRQVMLYALGVGASELVYVYEQDLQVLPTMAAILGYAGFVWRDPKYRADWRRILHGEIGFTLHAPLPIQSELIGRTSFGPVVDKGADKGAVVYQTRTVHTSDGTLLATIRSANFLRGDGGRGSAGNIDVPPPATMPARAPDLFCRLPTGANQAMIYRLSGDMNPLHIDPAVAKAGGFERPILHGLCTFGVAGRALLASVCGGDTKRVIRMDARFSSPVYPGETVVTEIWHEGAGRAAFRATVAERGAVVLNNGILEYK